MSDHSPAPASHDHGHGHDHSHGGIGQYVAVFVALCVLSSASFFTLSDFWTFGDGAAKVFMIAVSCAKALLVVLFFMHVKYEASWKYVLTIPASIMAIFLGLALIPDVGMRRNTYSEERIEAAAEPPAQEHAAEHRDH